MAPQVFERDESVRLADVCFEVEKCIFRVPRRLFEESAMFRDIFQLPVAKNAIRDGVSKDNPLRLDGIVKDEFKQLLRFIMMDPRLLEHGTIAFTLPEYTAVLKLSTMWELEKTREIVIQEMSALPIDFLEKIKLARQYHVIDWLVESLDEYAKSCKSITPEDVEHLGLDSILKIVKLRKAMIDNTYDSSRYDCEDALRRAFKEEIERVENFDSEETSARVDHKQFQDDDSFYFVDIYFLVENCLFKSHRQFFEASPIFRDLFRLPTAKNALPDGCRMEQPLHLDGIQKDDFKRFIKFLNTRFMQKTTFSLSEWTSILKLSTMWQFSKIRQFVVDQLSKLPIKVIEKIILARDYHISQWLIPALLEYTRGRQSITVEDVNDLGLDVFLKIIQVRERYGVHPEFKLRQSCDFRSAIRSAFRDEIRSGRATWSMTKTSTTPSVVITALRPKEDEVVLVEQLEEVQETERDLHWSILPPNKKKRRVY